MKPRKDRQSARRVAAHLRNTRWAALTPAQQLAELDKRLGVGVGAKKQRARLAMAPRGAAA